MFSLRLSQRNLTEYFVAVDVNNMLHLYASMLYERRVLICCSKLSTVSRGRGGRAQCPPGGAVSGRQTAGQASLEGAGRRGCDPKWAERWPLGSLRLVPPSLIYPIGWL